MANVYGDLDFQAGTAVFTDTIWDDQQVNLGSVGVGSSAPTWTAYRGGEVLAFDKAQSNLIYFNIQLSHKYKLGSNIEFHLHTVAPNDTAGTVGWVMTHSIADINEEFPVETTISAVETIGLESGNMHQFFEISANIGTAAELSSIIICSLYRDGPAAVAASDTYNNDIYLVALDAHIELDTVGSRTELTK